MPVDYPAAHSMDSCFFAVDQDGHVAYFETGEAGALPMEALSGEEARAVREQLAVLPRGQVIHDRQGRLMPPRTSEATEHCSQRLVRTGQVLMFLASLDAVQEEISAGRAVQVPASAGVAVLFSDLARERAEQLHAGGACLGCFWHYEEEVEEGDYPDLATRGLFTYAHLTENWISGPYGRECCPAQPIHIDQLPPRLRAAIGILRFSSLCFAHTPHIQPVEHGECVSWQSAYMDATGQHIRPLPGKEDTYAGDYDILARFGGENLHVEPPSGPTPAEDDE